MRAKLVIVFFLLFQLVGYTQNYKAELTTPSDFMLLAHKPLSNKYGFVKSLKIIYDLKSKKLYYSNSKRFKYHFEFVTEYLERQQSLDNFNEYNYAASHSKKEYLLANINFYESLNTYTLELSPADNMSIKDIQFLYELVKRTSFIQNLKLFLNTERLIDTKATLSLPTIKADAIYKNQQYQAISTEKSFGKLRFVNIDSLKWLNIKRTDIIIVDKPVLNLPIVNGVITTRMQTPLSHISVLGINRKIPVATYKNAYTSKSLRALKNQFVSFEVKLDTFYIKPVSLEKFQRKTKRRKNKIKTLKLDLQTNTLIPGVNLHHKLIKTVGGKAANFGELYKIASKTNGFKVPECSFAIPFYFYHQHVKSHKIDRLINNAIEEYTLHKNDSVLKVNLKQIRSDIKKAPINTSLITEIHTYLSQTDCSYDRIRFRSSTNAEDIVGFSGAGLYTSKTGIKNHQKKTFEKAIKTVWASLWKKRAFLERDLYNINQQSVAMGVLVHRSFPNEYANGVAITKNLYRKNFYGNVINLQLGEEPVVNPKPNVTSEQIICYEGAKVDLYKNKKVIEIISYSSLHNNQLILEQEKILNLSKQLYILKKHFYRKVYKRRKTFLNFGLDVEFKIDGPNKDLYIKQARYFND
ncbi:PEP/pyruvate-binding domain-containing protein [uncultured Tenacibaculum sp.]|uniref:PEP/pyruvate-binding domain-containing protein n=1 Tax=uncultured Tenacibaculum sp. TaxID=174713 RepID=UPI00262E3FA2|nr:PEP/pyruvate-binding domain-containing protein [uncultured Tenacibaculum sp.]